jgi:DinB superfamily
MAVPMLHEEGYRANIIDRLRTLRHDTPRRWGKMSVDQMLWHVNGGLSMALGEIEVPPRHLPVPRPVVRFVALNLPWPKGVPAMPMFVASRSYDFESERARCLQLIDQLAAKPLDDNWPPHPLLGKVSGRDASRLQARHLNHHLKQFGV